MLVRLVLARYQLDARHRLSISWDGSLLNPRCWGSRWLRNVIAVSYARVMVDGASPDSRIGSVIAGHRIERLLGRGGMSVVYLAHDPRLDRRVALKLLAPELAEDERFRERFLRESKLAASLDHPNVIPIFEAGEAEGVLFIAMRYVEGTDLKRLLTAEGRLDPARAAGIVERVAEALDVAHEQGLVHRDVKPGNVLLAQQAGREHVYLSDFGLTKQQASESGITETGQFMGTADYVSPEQIEHQDVSGRSDQYALACVLYECLTGQAPFRGDSLMGVLWGHLNRDATLASETNEELPSEINTVLAKGMAKEPAERYPSCGELAMEARSALGLSGELTAPTAMGGRTRRRRLMIAALVVIVAVIVAVVLAVVLTGGDDGTAVGPIIVDSLAHIDIETGEVDAVVPVGRGPAAVAVSDREVLTASRADGTVSIIDPVVGEVNQTVAVTGTPVAVASSDGDAWVASTSDGRGVLSQIDLEAGRIRREIDLGFSDPVAIAVGDQALWITARDQGGNAIVRVDPLSLEIEAIVDTEERPLDVVATDGAVWFTFTGSASFTDSIESNVVSRIDPATNEVAATVRVPTRVNSKPSLRLAATPDAAWVAEVRGSEIWRIDPLTDDVIETISLGDGGGVRCLAFAHGSLWVLVFDTPLTLFDPIRTELLRIDPDTEMVMERYRLDADSTVRTTALAAGPRGMWVTSIDVNDSVPDNSCAAEP